MPAAPVPARGASGPQTQQQQQQQGAGATPAEAVSARHSQQLETWDTKIQRGEEAVRATQEIVADLRQKRQQLVAAQQRESKALQALRAAQQQQQEELLGSG